MRCATTAAIFGAAAAAAVAAVAAAAIAAAGGMKSLPSARLCKLQSCPCNLRMSVATRFAPAAATPAAAAAARQRRLATGAFLCVSVSCLSAAAYYLTASSRLIDCLAELLDGHESNNYDIRQPQQLLLQLLLLLLAKSFLLRAADHRRRSNTE